MLRMMDRDADLERTESGQSNCDRQDNQAEKWARGRRRKYFDPVEMLIEKKRNSHQPDTRREVLTDRMT